VWRFQGGLVNPKLVAVKRERGPCACVFWGLSGMRVRLLCVRRHLMTDSNRLKILLSSQVQCLKRLDSSSKVTLPMCFYCLSHKSKGACPLYFHLHLSEMSSYIVNFYRDSFTALLAFASL